MKLRSIALSGLLGASLLMTSGCGTDDVAELVGDVLNQNVIYTVNGTGGDVTFSVTGAADTVVTDQNFTAHLLTGHESYDVSYPGVDPVSFASGSVYMYAATPCATASGYLQHEINANKVNVVNTTDFDIDPAAMQIVITQKDGTEHTVTETILQCDITPTPSLEGFVLENDMNVTVTISGIPLTQTITGLDPEVIAIGNTLKVDIVVFEKVVGPVTAATFTIVPMAGYDDLVAIGAGSL